MAKTKKKRTEKDKGQYPKIPGQQQTPTQHPPAQTIRETVESVVIAFVLAFLFRTFEAEAFVIPTGSMAPTLMGRHKDVECDQCGHRFRVNASGEDRESVSDMLARGQIGRAADANSVAGTCPVCRYTMPMRPDLPSSIPKERDGPPIEYQSSYSGDRILVNKYIYSFGEPDRWDVVVFKYPGNAQMNYIKRLVGLPNETLRVYQGDLFVGDENAAQDEDFQISRKPTEKILAMRQLVHDTDYDPVSLYESGWPLRWNPYPSGRTGGWQVERTGDEKTVQQRFAIDGSNDQLAWIRYQHYVPDYDDWQTVTSPGGTARLPGLSGIDAQPQLISDFNAYNTTVSNFEAARRGSLDADAKHGGYHWVGDLMVEANVTVEEPKGELVLDLVEGGRHFTCTIDLASGRATLGIEGVPDFARSAATPLKSTGAYRVAFANFDDQLKLWVGGKQVAFDGGGAYDFDALFGDRRQLLPKSSDEDPGDLAPVGIGARGAKLEIDRLKVWRDIYYIATSDEHTGRHMVTDADVFGQESPSEYMSNPARWDIFLKRRHVEFPLGEDQFFVMGDNSPESLDARLWRGGNGRTHGHPGGAYLERRLLIGKALCVYWPHSWNRIPGTPIPFPLFPNIADMRLVR